ncbi:hypothetical protein [Sporosarcina limicola]|uniref:Uncharacterized protein n=1 Tax=Sporosarcina limicola TaxID=34101 RepID=A0A927MPP5_9BACL|nr:hypothetical protein [Sporosarcina limicola]MBE1556987.1 hypothetical protein [Sporosarcina limicola]
MKWLKRLATMEMPLSDLDFGKLKIDLENWFYQEAFHAFDGDSMDVPSDYYTWRDLEEEKKEIFDILGGQ